MGHPIFYAGDDYQVSIIEEEAFYDNQYLTKIVLPEGIKEVQTRAFYNCRNLTETLFPSTITNIADNAFDGVTFDNITVKNNYVYALIGQRYSDAQTYKILKSVVDGADSEHDYINSSNFNISEDGQYYVYKKLNTITTQIVGGGKIYVQSSAYAGENVTVDVEEAINENTILLLKRLYYTNDGEDIDIINQNGYSFIMPNKPITIHAEFELKNTYTTYQGNKLNGFLYNSQGQLIRYNDNATSAIIPNTISLYEQITPNVLVINNKEELQPMIGGTNISYSFNAGYVYITDSTHQHELVKNMFLYLSNISEDSFPITVEFQDSYIITAQDISDILSSTSIDALPSIVGGSFLAISDYEIISFDYRLNGEEVVHVDGANYGEEYLKVASNYKSIETLEIFNIKRGQLIAYQGEDIQIKSISSGAFQSRTLKEITISQFIETIEDNAFYSCISLTDVTINSAKVYQNAVGVENNQAGGLLAYATTVKVPKSIAGSDVIDDSHLYLNSTNFDISEEGDYYIYQLKTG